MHSGLPKQWVQKVSVQRSRSFGQKAGPYAQKYGMQVILHQHLQPGQPGWTFEKFLEMSPNNMLNFDAGHYFGATGLHPNALLRNFTTG